MKTLAKPVWESLAGFFVLCLLLCSGQALAAVYPTQQEVNSEIAYVTADIDALADISFPEQDKILHVPQRFSLTAPDQTGPEKHKKVFYSQLSLLAPVYSLLPILGKKYEGIFSLLSFQKRHILYCIYRI